MARFSALLVAVLAAARLGGAELDQAVEALRQQNGLREAGVAVVIIGDRGEVLAAIAPDVPLKPASNQKVLTAAAALHGLGMDCKYQTRLEASAPVVGGRLPGDLVVRGGG